MEAECSDDVMKLRVKFNATFSGLIYSAGRTATDFLTSHNTTFYIAQLVAHWLGTSEVVGQILVRERIKKNQNLNAV